MKQDFELEIAVNRSDPVRFTIGQIPHGEHKDKWVWATPTDESDVFETAAQAQQDAMRYVREQQSGEHERVELEADERRFGSYEQQVEAEWKAGRL